ncbi:PREDICTED: FAST kinase domain-containing protein 1 [Tinamus guttatus]|uniref:FAST kinase domain-containing protein 1 n=1 Tax=Tinamus guttatus TaxID=94827 RepID=UPI00052E83F8|nr:PREDICTED: FAST kinase domain-containing protein 1 [Tinamus guttatus]
MVCLRQICLLTQRYCQVRALSSDLLLSQINSCTHEDELFGLIGKNKARLSEKHVGSALNVLWQLQKKKPLPLRTSNYIRNHSQFFILRVLAENKVERMENDVVVDILYSILRLNVEDHDCLAEALVTEAWKRLERLSLPALSKFALCLYKQHMYFSPLLGKIAHIVDTKLDSIHDIRILSVLMISISDVISLSFRDRLIQKAEELLGAEDEDHFNYARRIVQFLQNVKLAHRPLLEKCNKIFLKSACHLDIHNICLIFGLYEQLGFDNAEFRLITKQLLSKSIDDYNDPETFTKLFFALGPMAGPKVRERLLATAVSMAEELSSYQVLVILKTMQKMKCKNSHLLQKVASILHKHLDNYHTIQLVKLTQYLVLLGCHDLELFGKLKKLLFGFLVSSVIPADIAAIIRVVAMLPSTQVEEVLLTRAAAVLPQCRLPDLNSIAAALVRWNHYGQPPGQSLSELCAGLLQELNHWGSRRLRGTNSLDLLLEELTYVNRGGWFEEVLCEETMSACQRLLDQVTRANVLQFSFFLIKANHRCVPLLDRIASVTLQNIDKIHPFEIYFILYLFSILNYDSPANEEFFENCIQHLMLNLSCFESHYLVLLGHILAVAGYFPPVLIKMIFNVSFLSKLDAELEVLPDTSKQKVRACLMKLNRAVCLECPEFHIPWFHEHYCQHVLFKGSRRINSLRHVHRMLTEILGGSNYLKISVLTPYCYEIDFECILDKNKRPLSYMSQNILLGDMEGIHSKRGIKDTALPPGAQRIALEFLDPKAFSKDSHHVKGESAVKKRHLEMLGYRVVQIPHFEWNSMVLSTKEAQLEYLKKHLYETQ